MRRFTWLGVVAGVVLVVAYPVSRAPAVEVVRPEPRQVVESIAVSGQVHGREESNLAPEVTAAVAEVLVAEGHQVQRGELLVRLDGKLLEAELAQALEGVSGAEAELRVAARPPLQSEVDRVEAESGREGRPRGARGRATKVA